MGYSDYCIDISYTVRDAMRNIDTNDPKIVFIVEGKKLIASLTDGDVRRFLLNGGGMEEPAVNAGNRKLLCARDMAKAARLYHQRNYIAIPIVNSDNEILDIYIGRTAADKPAARLNIPVVINAGGRGTRLEPYTRIFPKPLIPVGEMPIIEHIMRQFMGYACSRFHIIVNYKKELLKAYFADCAGYDILWYDEDQPLGTGGGLCYLKGKMEETFFFTNCDNLLLSDYESILRFHKDNRNMITMVCAYKNLAIPYGVVEMGANGIVTSMQEKPELSFLTNTGVYIVEPEVLRDIEDNVPVGFPDIIEKERAKGRRIAVYPVSENDWLDMGQLPELDKMHKRLYGE